jgi:hypothetical protein
MKTMGDEHASPSSLTYIGADGRQGCGIWDSIELRKADAGWHCGPVISYYPEPFRVGKVSRASGLASRSSDFLFGQASGKPLQDHNRRKHKNDG